MTAITPPRQYDDVADAYDRWVRPRYAPIAALVVDRASELTALGPISVVELSAGTGALTHQLAPLVGSYVATDVSEPMMAVGRACAASACRRVRWLLADVEDIGLAEGSADTVVSSLGPVQDSDRALTETWRLLRPGGRLVACAWGDDYLELDLLQRARAHLGLPPRPVPGTREELRRRLGRTGFDDVVIEQVRMPVVHASVETYLAYRRAFGQLPDGIVEVSEVRQALTSSAQEYVDGAGRLVLDWQLLVISAQRVGEGGEPPGSTSPCPGNSR